MVNPVRASKKRLDDSTNNEKNPKWYSQTGQSVLRRKFGRIGVEYTLWKWV